MIVAHSLTPFMISQASMQLDGLRLFSQKWLAKLRMWENILIV